MPDQWLVLVTGPQLVEEIRKFSDDQVSFDHALEAVSNRSFVVYRAILTFTLLAF